MTQAVGVVAIGVAAGTLKNPLAQQARKAVVDIGRVPLILDGAGQAFDQPSLMIHTMKQQSAEVTGQPFPI